MSGKTTIYFLQTVFMKKKLIILLLCGVFAVPMYSNFTVNSAADTPDHTLGDNICADVNGFCTLRAAIQEANNTTSIVFVINFMPSFNSTITLSSNLPNITTSTFLIITGGALGNVVIDGDMTYTAFSTGSNGNIELTGLVIQNTNGIMSSALTNLGGTVTIFNSTIDNATAFNFGGAIRNDGILNINRSTISNNSTPSFLGGGAISNFGELIIDQSTISGNSAPVRGGAIYNNDGDITITNSLLYNNSTYNPPNASSPSGGAIYGSNASTTTLINSTVSGNSAGEGAGGGIGCVGELILNNCTFTKNIAGTGGAVDVRGGDLTMSSTILANSIPSAGSIQDLLVNSASNLDIIKKNNLIEICSSVLSCPPVIPDLNNPSDYNYLTSDPQLNDLADNGGYTFTHLPCPSSPVIDNGLGAASGSDQRGESYIDVPNIPFCSQPSDIADIGAVEVQLSELSASGGFCSNFSIEIYAKVFLKGAYTSGGVMNTHLNTANLLPTVVGGYTMQASAMSQSGTETIVDWVSIELRCADDNTSIIAERPALLQADGDVVDMDGSSPVEFTDVSVSSAYIVIRHRNHLGTMSANPINFN